MNINKKDLEFMDNISDNILSYSTAFLIKSIKENRNLSEEEKQKREEIIKTRGLYQKEQSRITTIIQNRCPICYGKLERGKKDKKMNYQRQWKCKDCEEIHYA